MTFEEAAKTALVEVKDPYAQTYLNALEEAYSMYNDEGLKVQILYCLSNMQHYRGETARAVKKAFKQKVKELGQVNPTKSAKAVAQVVERQDMDLEVVGSSPTRLFAGVVGAA